MKGDEDLVGFNKLKLCPDCGKRRKCWLFRRGPWGDCCLSCYRGYLPD